MWVLRPGTEARDHHGSLSKRAKVRTDSEQSANETYMSVEDLSRVPVLCPTDNVHVAGRHGSLFYPGCVCGTRSERESGRNAATRTDSKGHCSRHASPRRRGSDLTAGEGRRVERNASNSFSPGPRCNCNTHRGPRPCKGCLEEATWRYEMTADGGRRGVQAGARQPSRALTHVARTPTRPGGARAGSWCSEGRLTGGVGAQEPNMVRGRVRGV